MSVFEAGTEQQNSEEKTQTQESFVTKLVEARGEKWSDPEVIAKGKLEADTHIVELERQLAEMREDMAKQDYAKTVLETIQSKAGGTGAPNSEQHTSTDSQDTTDESSDIASLVEKALQEREVKTRAEANVAAVDKALEEKYGTEAVKAVTDKANQLGLSLARMKELASESPDAFMTLVGEPMTKKTNTLPSSSVNTQSSSFNSSTERDWAYYQKLRKENKKLYYTPKVQQQLLEDKARLGDRFNM